MSDAFWRGRRVFLTGHTGFKGSWLALWLHAMGAEVTGFALRAEPVSLFNQGRIGELITHIEGDIRDLAAVEAAMQAAQPTVVLHLAAQPLVRKSYVEPVETYATNVQGTVHVLDACRRVPGLEAIVCVTSDKCYENREWVWPYREDDPMGGYDPYSSSKGAAELVAAAYRRSYFSTVPGPRLATVRAGNVIGGGDWAEDRLVPDIVRALLGSAAPLIRAPHSVRPWQHVLEALSGYLLVAQRLAGGQSGIDGGWNFGPAENDARPVSWIADQLMAAWSGAAPGTGWVDASSGEAVHEARLLRLDCAKARADLGWRTALSLQDALDLIVDWHKAVSAGDDARGVTQAQLRDYRGRCAALA
ncbi:MAG: CDP-glucose 4,6-dehydratase [Novosphingobium sp.]